MEKENDSRLDPCNPGLNLEYVILKSGHREWKVDYSRFSETRLSVKVKKSYLHLGNDLNSLEI